MKLYIIIPAYNEAIFIGKTLQSLVNQTTLPDQIIVVNDKSTDATADVVSSFVLNHPYISLVNTTSIGGAHAPGSKIIQAFKAGYNTIVEDYDILCKFDADLIFPPNYIETIKSHFKSNPKIGMAGGFCIIKQNEKWILENLTGKDHIRGALKAYRKECFLQIGKLRSEMGWDTVDELLALYYGWQIKTDDTLLVKHLKPTGSSYTSQSKFKQGEAFYRLRYGFFITSIASAKLAYRKKEIRLFYTYLKGFFKAKKKKLPFLVSKEEGSFIRQLRWKKMKEKIFNQ